MPDFARILKADRPLSLTSVPRGAQPLVMADLARAAKGRAVFIAPDEQAMRAVTDAARWFAPELQVIEFPAWDCLPYDRASPALSVASRRLSALHQLQAGKTGSQLLVTTVNAALQRVLHAVPHPRGGARTQAGDADRLRQPDRAAPAAGLQPHRHGHRHRRVRGARLDLRHVPGRARPGPAARFLRRRARIAAAVRSGHPAHDRHASTATCCCPRARRCSTRTASSASAPATASGSAPTRRRTRSTRRSAKGAGSRGWSTGCRCSRTSWRRCSTIWAPTTWW